MRLRTQLSSLIILTGILISPALAQSPPADPAKVDATIDTLLGEDSHTKVHLILTNLQLAVAKHDAAAVAALVHYPIRVKLHGKPTDINKPQSFIKHYDNIITPDIVDVIAKQKYEDLFVNYQGAMLGEGEVWITGFCIDNACKPPDIKIGTIQSATAISKK
ncbi:MAG TPA: hypothetical protein VIX90_08455 [Edaphobacter sp.]